MTDRIKMRERAPVRGKNLGAGRMSLRMFFTVSSFHAETPGMH
jgi:hypothetical protein